MLFDVIAFQLCVNEVQTPLAGCHFKPDFWFLIIFDRLLVGELLMSAIASPKGEQAKMGDGGSEVKYTYEQRINAVRGSSAGQGEMPMEYLQAHSRCPVGDEIHVQFALQNNNKMGLNFESAIYREPRDP